jgi:hypothetical protein
MPQPTALPRAPVGDIMNAKVRIGNGKKYWEQNLRNVELTFLSKY